MTDEQSTGLEGDVYLDEPWAKYWDYVSPITEAELALTVLDRFEAPGNGFSIFYKGTTWSHDDVDRAVSAVAARLLDGSLERGDRVAVMLQNQPEFVVSVLAAWRAGLVIVPVNPMYRRVELEHLFADSGARAAIVLDELLDHVLSATADRGLDLVVQVGEAPSRPEIVGFADILAAEPVDASRFADRAAPESPAFLCYTSGTTGPAKGAVLTHRSVMMGTLVFQRIQQLGPDDVNLAIAPLFHVTGLIAGLTISSITGMRLVLDFRFDADAVLALLRDQKVTYTVGPTTVFRALLKHEGFTRDVFAHTRKIICGGAPIPKDFSDQFEEATGQRLHSGYGMTETSSPCFGTPRTSPSPVQDGIGLLALGIPAPGTQCRLLDDDGNPVPVGEPGEIVVRGPQVMAEYWRNPEETARSLSDGWLRTGDVAVMNEDGWFFMVDRKKNQINASGFKVWPTEVEDVLRSHPAIEDAGVVGVPDDYRGETVKAVIELVPGASLDEAELRQFCRANLAAYKVPTIIRFVDQLPRSVAGKVVRQDLIAL